MSVRSSASRSICTRRGFVSCALASFASAAPQKPALRKSRPLPNVGEFTRLVDPTTEAQLYRLTNPDKSSFLSAPTNRFVSLRSHSLLFSADRTGKLSPFQLDLRSGVVKQLCETHKLDPKSLCFDATEKELFLIDEGALRRINIERGHNEVLAEGVSAYSVSRQPSAIVTVQGDRLIAVGSSTVLAQGALPWCLVSPNGEACLFSRNAADSLEYWHLSLRETAREPVRLAAGAISNAVWSPRGNSVLFLRDVPGNNALVSEIHEVDCQSCTEQRVSWTSQFGAFAPNGDGSVFVGASRSRAQPTVNLLLRSPQREMTLCEHRASHPSSVQPVFSPDSRRVFFQSDHQGKSALYLIGVEQLVEPTDPASA